MCHPSQTPGLTVSCTIAFVFVKCLERHKHRWTEMCSLDICFDTHIHTHVISHTIDLCVCTTRNKAHEYCVLNARKIALIYTNNTIIWQCQGQYSKSAKWTSSGVTLSYTIKCTASYDSIPYSLADSVRLESSSKGSSCPAVEYVNMSDWTH